MKIKYNKNIYNIDINKVDEEGYIDIDGKMVDITDCTAIVEVDEVIDEDGYEEDECGTLVGSVTFSSKEGKVNADVVLTGKSYHYSGWHGGEWLEPEENGFNCTSARVTCATLTTKNDFELDAEVVDLDCGLFSCRA